MIVLIEAYLSEGEGSEGASGSEWIDAACRNCKTTKVIVLTSQQRTPRSEKEEIHYIAEPWPPDWVRHLPDKRLYYPFLILRYCLWLERSKKAAFELGRKYKIALSLHVSFSSLLLGTRLPNNVGVRVLAGSWVCRTPASFSRYLPPLELLAQQLNPLVGICTMPRRNVDVIAAANAAAKEALSRFHPHTQFDIVPEPTKVLPELPTKGDYCIYFDKWTPRRGRTILLDYFRQYKSSPIPLEVYSEAPHHWNGIENVKAAPLLSQEAFKSKLAESAFVLSTSWREGGSGSSVIIQGASAKSIPIVFDVVPYKYMPDAAKIAMPCQGNLTESIHSALQRAAEMPIDERQTRALAAQQWAFDTCSHDRLEELLNKWLELAQSKMPQLQGT